MDIRKKLTGAEGRWGKEGEGSNQETCIKDPWEKTMVVGKGLEDGVWAGLRRVMGEKIWTIVIEQQ